MKKHSAIGPVILISFWAIVAQLQLVDKFFLPGPWTTIKKLFEMIGTDSVFKDLFSTLQRVVLAFVISVIAGLPLGLWLGQTEKTYRSVEFIIDFFRSMPATALFPLFLLVFGVTDESKIAAAAFASLFIIIFNTAYGVMHARKARILAAQIMGANKLQTFRWILFYEALP